MRSLADLPNTNHKAIVVLDPHLITPGYGHLNVFQDADETACKQDRDLGRITHRQTYREAGAFEELMHSSRATEKLVGRALHRIIGLIATEIQTSNVIPSHFVFSNGELEDLRKC